jgi:biotin synthase
MVALTRLYLKDVNIAAATALDALHPDGRLRALRAGANILMPLLTPEPYRAQYALYEKKAAAQTADAIIKNAGSEPGYGEWGDSLHYKRERGK